MDAQAGGVGVWGRPSFGEGGRGCSWDGFMKVLAEKVRIGIFRSFRIDPGRKGAGSTFFLSLNNSLREYLDYFVQRF